MLFKVTVYIIIALAIHYYFYQNIMAVLWAIIGFAGICTGYINVYSIYDTRHRELNVANSFDDANRDKTKIEKARSSVEMARISVGSTRVSSPRVTLGSTAERLSDRPSALERLSARSSSPRVSKEEAKEWSDYIRIDTWTVKQQYEPEFDIEIIPSPRSGDDCIECEPGKKENSQINNNSNYDLDDLDNMQVF